MRQLVFAYGTLLIPAVQEAVIGRRIAGTRDRLPGFRKSMLLDREDSFPNLAPDPEGRVSGCVIEIDAQELGRIDLYEGDLYARHKVTLESGTEAWAYFA